MAKMTRATYHQALVDPWKFVQTWINNSKLKPKEIAANAGIPWSTYRSYSQGHNPNPSYPVLQKLLRYVMSEIGEPI